MEVCALLSVILVSTYAEQVILIISVRETLGKRDNSKVLRRFLLNALDVAAYLLGRTRKK